jgi:hypothetical protein
MVYDIEHVKQSFPVINDVESLAKYITFADLHDHLTHIKTMLKTFNYIDNDDSLTISNKPFNVFAHIGSGQLSPAVNQSTIGTFANMFVVCQNRPENDARWDESNFQSGAMAGPDLYGPGHVFITIKDLFWGNFNILTLILRRRTSIILALKQAGTLYAKNRGWIHFECYFHCFPHNSVNSLHMHVVNLDTAGPHFHKQKYKS